MSQLAGYRAREHPKGTQDGGPTLISAQPLPGAGGGPGTFEAGAPRAGARLVAQGGQASGAVLLSLTVNLGLILTEPSSSTARAGLTGGLPLEKQRPLLTCNRGKEAETSRPVYSPQSQLGDTSPASKGGRGPPCLSSGVPYSWRETWRMREKCFHLNQRGSSVLVY